MAAGEVEELRAERAGPRLEVDVEGAVDGWVEAVPAAAVVGRTGRGLLIELGPGGDDQDVLDAARRAGRVRRFVPARPTLAELFREVVES